MNEDEFWRLVDASAAESDGNFDKRASVLLRRLSALPPDEIVELDFELGRRTFAAYHNDLWTAAHLVLSGCSEDCFLDFRRWLISRGRAAFYECLGDADRVAWWMEGEEAVVFEDLGSVVSQAYKVRTGNELPRRLPPDLVRPESPAGPEVDLSEPVVARRFPRLHAFVLADGGWPAEWT